MVEEDSSFKKSIYTVVHSFWRGYGETNWTDFALFVEVCVCVIFGWGFVKGFFFLAFFHLESFLLSFLSLLERGNSRSFGS